MKQKEKKTMIAVFRSVIRASSNWYGCIHRTLCFWTGHDAKLLANQNTTHCSDKKFAMIKDLFASLSLIREFVGAHDFLMTEMSFEVSSLFAHFAQETVHVYISHDKESEMFPGFTTGTNFWNSELPIIMQSYHAGKITRIIWHVLYAKQWIICNNMLPTCFLQFRLWRREFHTFLDDVAHKQNFVLQDFTQVQYDHWRLQPIRPSIKLSTMMHIITKWKHYKKKFY